MLKFFYIGDLNVHHTDWLQSTHTDVGGTEVFHFSISNELEQIIKHPTRVPDRHNHAANTLDLFFTSNPQNYTYNVSSPLGSSDHCTASVTSSFTPPPPIPSTQQISNISRSACSVSSGDMRRNGHPESLSRFPICLIFCLQMHPGLTGMHICRT